MECKHAYMKQNIDYVLCDKEKNPNPNNRTELFHACCPHQTHCPAKNCHKLSASWLRCIKLAETHQNAFEAVLDEVVSAPDEATKKPTRRTRKNKAEE